MKPLYTPELFELSKSRSRLPLKCEYCHSTFFQTKNEIQKSIKRQLENNPRRNSLKYCSKDCSNKNKYTGKIIQCKQCEKKIYKQQKDIKNSKCNFCSSSCAATYNNTHKTKGYRRSKLEKWIETQLSNKYLNLHIDYNKTSVVNFELDIFIPKLKLAFELNGIFHYEDIYGTLSKIQNNDTQKYQNCIKNGISLCVIDTSQQKKFTPQSSEKYFSIITEIIDKKWGDVRNSNPL